MTCQTEKGLPEPLALKLLFQCADRKVRSNVADETNSELNICSCASHTVLQHCNQADNLHLTPPRCKLSNGNASCSSGVTVNILKDAFIPTQSPPSLDWSLSLKQRRHTMSNRCGYVSGHC